MRSSEHNIIPNLLFISKLLLLAAFSGQKLPKDSLFPTKFVTNNKFRYLFISIVLKKLALEVLFSSSPFKNLISKAGESLHLKNKILKVSLSVVKLCYVKENKEEV